MNMHSPAPQVKVDDHSTSCEQCGEPFAKREGSGGKPQKFCSPECRQAFHSDSQRSQRSPTCDVATVPAATPIADPVKAATEACEAQIAAILGEQPEEQFDWIKDDSIILE